MIELVLGGARSGKSRYAEQRAANSAKQVIYVATGEARDAEMVARIIQHRQARPQHWQTLEEPIQLAKIIKNQSNNKTCLLIDCLTLWLSNILFNRRGELQETVFEYETQALYRVLPTITEPLILVTNEIGLGVVPIDKMARRFVDEAGLLHQHLALLSDRVVLITAGLPHVLK